jgi:hypothetical protein
MRQSCPTSLSPRTSSIATRRRCSLATTGCKGCPTSSILMRAAWILAWRTMVAEMLARNPQRMDYELRYDEIVAGYNREKDRTTIEETFRLLLALAKELGRVEVWRGDVRLSMSVPAPFVWRCLSGSTIAPFPHPAHRTGQADFPHPALGQDSRRLSRATPSAASEHHVELIDPMGRRIATIALAE